MQFFIKECLTFSSFKEISHIESFINEIISDKSNYLWFEDEKGQRFVPNGKIHIGIASGFSKKE